MVNVTRPKPPEITFQDLTRRLVAKFGNDAVMVAMDKRWRSLHKTAQSVGGLVGQKYV